MNIVNNENTFIDEKKIHILYLSVKAFFFFFLNTERQY